MSALILTIRRYWAKGGRDKVEKAWYSVYVCLYTGLSTYKNNNNNKFIFTAIKRFSLNRTPSVRNRAEQKQKLQTFYHLESQFKFLQFLLPIYREMRFLKLPWRVTSLIYFTDVKREFALLS